MKKILSVILSLIMATSVIFVMPVSAVNTDVEEIGYSVPDEAGFLAKLNQLRSKYPNGGTWSGAYYENGTAKAWQCFGYANQMLYEVFGAQFYNDGFYNKKDYNMGTIYAGDWVRIVTYGEPNNHSIFITKVTNDRVYFTDANWNGKNGIRWDASYTKAELAQKFSYKVHIPGNTLTGNGVATPVNNPQGCFDWVKSNSPGTIQVHGWAFDRDNLGASLAIHIYVGGPAGSGAPGYAITANKSRPDVNNAYPGVGNNHGFDDTIRVSKTGLQTIYVYAINVGSGNDNPLLGYQNVVVKSDTEKPTISNITVSQVTSKGFRISCKVSDNVGVTQVKFPTWTLKTDAKGNNQDDLVWHVGSINGNIATYYVKTSDHNNETGGYVTDIYAYDNAGNSSIARASVSVTNEPKMINSTEYNGNTYKVFNSGMTWTQAKEWCEKQGGHLATISNSSEWNVVKQALEKYNGVPCWLGAESTSGNWKWVTGENLTYTNWSSGQPDCAGKNEFYLGTFNDSKKWLDCYLWNDYPNDGAGLIGGFVCEFEKTTTTKPTVSEPNNTIWAENLDIDYRSLMRKGTKQKIVTNITPKNATNKKIEWYSRNPSVATVSNTGIVTAKRVGNVTICATIDIDVDTTLTCFAEIRVVEPVSKVTIKYRGVTYNNRSISTKKGKNLTLSAVCSPTNAYNRKVSWTSTNNRIATVTQSGKVKAKKKGACYIKATAKDGSKKYARVKINVK